MIVTVKLNLKDNDVLDETGGYDLERVLHGLSKIDWLVGHGIWIIIPGGITLGQRPREERKE